MKILLVQLIGKGGVQVYTSQLANALSQTNNEVVVLLGQYLINDRYYSKLNAKIIPVKTYPSYIKMGLKMINPFTYYNLMKIINRERPDVIHILFEDILLSTTILFLKNKYPVVFTDHDPSFHEGERFFSKFNHGLAKVITRKSDAIIVHGERMKEILVNANVPKDNIFCIPHGEYSYYTQWENERINEEKAVLFFGRVEEYKGIRYLIEAEPLITARVPKSKIIVAGSGNFEQYKKLILNIDNFEIHNRFIPDEEVADFFKRASVVVLPYIDGTQTGVIPIAYSFKKPVVVTDVGSIPEVVDNGKTGYVVPSKDPVSLANAIIKILTDDRLRAEMGENAFQKTKNEMSWENISKNTIEIYKTVLNK